MRLKLILEQILEALTINKWSPSNVLDAGMYQIN